MSGSRAFCDLQTKTISGTSMATPAVAGAAAVFLSEFPNKTPKEAKAYLKCSAIDGTISDVKGTPNKFLHVSTSVKQSCLSGGGGGGGGGSGGGSPPAATPAPVPVPATPAPVPAPPGACQDKSPSVCGAAGTTTASSRTIFQLNSIGLSSAAYMAWLRTRGAIFGCMYVCMDGWMYV